MYLMDRGMGGSGEMLHWGGVTPAEALRYAMSVTALGNPALGIHSFAKNRT